MMVKFNVKIASIRTPRAEYTMCAIGQGKQHQGGGETASGGRGKQHQGGGETVSGGRGNRGETKELGNSITGAMRKHEEKTRKQHHRKGEETGGEN